MGIQRSQKKSRRKVRSAKSDVKEQEMSGSEHSKYWQNDFFLKYVIVTGILASILTQFFIFLAIAVTPDFDWIDNNLSDLAVTPFGKDSHPFINAGLLIGCFGMIPGCVYYLNFYLKHLDHTALVGSIFLTITCLMIGVEGIFTASWTEIHRLGASLFMVAYTWSLLAFAVSDFKHQKTRKIAMLNVTVAILLWVMWGYIFSISVGSERKGYAIAEEIMIIFYIVTGYAHLYKMWFVGLEEKFKEEEKGKILRFGN